jgi:hypothetical protein
VTALAAASSSAAWDQPGTLGFLVVFGMGIVLYFVFRSMTRHLRKVNDAARAEEAEQSADAGEVGGQRSDGTVTMADGTVTTSSGDRSAGDRG